MAQTLFRVLFGGLGLVFLLSTPLSAQDLPQAGGDFEIETDAASAGADWSRYIGGTFRVVSADGDTVSRQLVALQVDIDLPAGENVKTVISLDVADFENSYTQQLRRDVDETPLLPRRRETVVADSFADLSEAYVQWQPTDFATVSVGRQNLIWGQFEFLSPVGFLLPYSGTNTSPRPRRADFSYTQDGITLALYPTRNSEL